MAALSSTNELESQLKEVGKKLSNPPSSIEEILDLLDNAEEFLSYVAQTPSESMLKALFPFMNALISDALLSHPDVNVKVSVASCISEIARITAPVSPYNDEIMKAIFQLNVMAFGKLSHVSGHCYSKALRILNSTALVQSYNLMVNLELDDLILEMFLKFLSTIRSNHPHDVFPNMEKIMTNIIEESKEVPVELLSCLVWSVRKEDQSISPISWKLGEKVLKNCAGTLKACLPGMMQSLSLDPDNYAEVVASICQDAQKMEAEGPLTDVHSPGEIGQSVARIRIPLRETRTKREKIPNKRLQDYLTGEAFELEVQNQKKMSDGSRFFPKLVSPSATTSATRGGNHLSESSTKKSTSCKEKAREINEYGDKLVGFRIKVWWPADKVFYDGVVTAFDPSEEKHTVSYDDGDEETLNLHDEQWELLNHTSPDQEPNADMPCLPTQEEHRDSMEAEARDARSGKKRRRLDKGGEMHASHS